MCDHTGDTYEEDAGESADGGIIYQTISVRCSDCGEELYTYSTPVGTVEGLRW